MRIDSHQHFWIYQPSEHGWINDQMSVLKHDFLPQHLLPLLTQQGYGGCVAVQAAQSDQETEFLLDLADKYDFILGVVGWIDLQSSQLSHQLNAYQHNPKLKGFRHIVQDEADDQFLLRPSFIEGVKTIQAAGYSYDILIYAHHLEVTARFLAAFDDPRFVIDHIAKPDIRHGGFASWKAGITKLARYPQVFAKLSGMVTEADWQNWTTKDLIPYLDVCLECFGPQRLMIGSDWPVCLLAGSYEKVLSVVEDFISTLSVTEQAAILGGNARAFYYL